MYDFDRDDRDRVYNVSPRELWEVQYGGYAKGFYVSGSETYSIMWTDGERIGSGAIILQ